MKRPPIAHSNWNFPFGFDLRSQAKIGLNLTLTLIERDFSGKLTYADNTPSGAIVTATVPYQG